jgi:hypothetical protein
MMTEWWTEKDFKKKCMASFYVLSWHFAWGEMRNTVKILVQNKQLEIETELLDIWSRNANHSASPSIQSNQCLALRREVLTAVDCEEYCLLGYDAMHWVDHCKLFGGTCSLSLQFTRLHSFTFQKTVILMTLTVHSWLHTAVTQQPNVFEPFFVTSTELFGSKLQSRMRSLSFENYHRQYIIPWSACRNNENYVIISFDTMQHGSYLLFLLFS